MRYHYIALSQDSREMNGVIEANNETEARTKLNELSMSVISLELIDENAALISKETATTKTEVAVFEFEAFDKNNKKVVGTIAATNEVSAFTRLFEEYRLSVYYLANSSLDAQSKKQVREKGITDVQAKYDIAKSEQKLEKGDKKTTTLNQQTANSQDQSVNGQQQSSNSNTNADDLQKKQELLETVNRTLAKINEFVAQFGTQIKQEERDIIVSYNNQLMRIKDSSNLDHIRATCEKMLSHIQKQELFVNEMEKRKESVQLKLETSKLLDELNVGNLNKNISVSDFLEKSKNNPFLKGIISWLQSIFPPLTPQMREKKNKIDATSMHMKSYYKSLLTGSSKALRAEAWEAIKNLRTQKKRLNLEFNALKGEEQRVMEAEQNISTEDSEKEWGSLVGFLSAFYLIAYFTTFLFTIKRTPFSLPQNFFFYETRYIKAISLFLFLIYCGKAFFKLNDRYNMGAVKIVTYTLVSVGFVLIAVNLF